MTKPLGFSGAVAKRFQDNALTPLLALAGVLLGLFAVLVTPREEEPQIDVTFANVFVAFPGASSSNIENLVSIPMEQVLAEIEGVKHVYSVSQPGLAVLTVQFTVGEQRSEALVRLYNAIYSNQDWRPANSGILPPLVKPMGIDDVPIVTATLWSDDDTHGTHELLMVAHALEAELKRIPGTRDVYTVRNIAVDEQAASVRFWTNARRPAFRTPRRQLRTTCRCPGFRQHPVSGTSWSIF